MRIDLKLSRSKGIPSPPLLPLSASCGPNNNPRYPAYYCNNYLLLKFIFNSRSNDPRYSHTDEIIDPMTRPPSRKPLLRALSGETVSPIPWWLMRQAGRFLPEYRELRSKAPGFLDFCFNPELACEATLQPLRRFGMSAAILFSDILVIPHALGQKVTFVEGEGPVLAPLDNALSLQGLEISMLGERLSPILETVRRVAKALPDDTALIGFAGAPWTVAVYMVEERGGTDCSKIKKLFLERPADGAALIGLLVQATASYLIDQVKNGVEAIQIFDSWAGILSEEEFRRWVIAPTRQLVSLLRGECPGVPIIGFPRGAGAMYPEYVKATGVDAVGIDSLVPVGWAARELQPFATVQGNLDNQVLRVGGRPLENEARRIMHGLAEGPFVFNLGHGVLPDTPPEHVVALAGILRGRG